MPIGGKRQDKYEALRGSSMYKSPMYNYAKTFLETANNILTESNMDIFRNPDDIYEGRTSSKEAMKRFFVENSYDVNNTTMCPEEIEDHIYMMENQFDNDVEAMHENNVLSDFNPIVGMSVPIHKYILMNMVFDKGGIQKFTAVEPRFTICQERRVLIAPDGTEIDMFTQQNQMTAAINSAAPITELEMNLPELGETDIVTLLHGDPDVDRLILGTCISAYKIADCVFEVGDLLPNEDGYIDDDSELATEKVTKDVWVRTNIKLTPQYGGPNRFERAAIQPITYKIKKDNEGTPELTEIKDSISIVLTKNDRFEISAVRGNIKAIRLLTRLDSSNGLLKTASVSWHIDQDYVEIDTSLPINTTVSPEEIKDISALYNVNQLTKIMSLYQTALANYKDDTIKSKLDESYARLEKPAKGHAKFNFAPREGFDLDHVTWIQNTFFFFFDDLCTTMLQVLNDPNMTFTIYGDPSLIGKITPTEYTYSAPGSIGPVTLDYTQTVVDTKDRRVYSFIGSDKMRGSNQFMILIKPNNSDRIIYRIYDYQLYVSNEIRNAKNFALPNAMAFERWKFVEYNGVQYRVDILNPSGLVE